MATVQWTLTEVNPERMAAIRARSALLEAAIEDKTNQLGALLLQRVHENLSGEVLHQRSGQLIGSVEMRAAQYVGAVCQTSVGVDDGSPSFLVGYVQEYGHGAYDIVPHETWEGLAGLSGAGKISRYSGAGSIARKEGRLPHSLAWEGPEGMVFAMHVHVPASEGKSWLRSALWEMEEQIYAEYQAVLEAILGGGGASPGSISSSSPLSPSLAGAAEATA